MKIDRNSKKKHFPILTGNPNISWAKNEFRFLCELYRLVLQR